MVTMINGSLYTYEKYLWNDEGDDMSEYQKQLEETIDAAKKLITESSELKKLSREIEQARAAAERQASERTQGESEPSS